MRESALTPVSTSSGGGICGTGTAQPTYSVASDLGDPPPGSPTRGRGRPWCLGRSRGLSPRVLWRGIRLQPLLAIIAMIEVQSLPVGRQSRFINGRVGWLQGAGDARTKSPAGAGLESDLGRAGGASAVPTSSVWSARPARTAMESPRTSPWAGDGGRVASIRHQSTRFSSTRR